MSILKKINAFLFNYRASQPFGFLRIAVALFCIIYLGCMYTEMQNLIGINGYVGRVTSEAINIRFTPKISWLLKPLNNGGFTDSNSINIIIGIYFTAMLLMLAGLFTRVSVFFVWMIHLMIYNSTAIFSYGTDAFLNILLFYCLIMPVGRYASLDNFLFNKRTKADSIIYESFFMRVLQVHICVAYFFSGFNKLIMPGWLNGESIWQALMLPNFRVVDFTFLAAHPFILKIILLFATMLTFP